MVTIDTIKRQARVFKSEYAACLKGCYNNPDHGAMIDDMSVLIELILSAE